MRQRRRPMSPKEDQDLNTKIEVVRVELANLASKVSDFIGESRSRWTEFKVDLAERVTRVESQALEGGKMLVERVEKLERTAVLVADQKSLDERVVLLEKNIVAASAVASYKRWLISTALVAVTSLLLNVARVVEIWRVAP